MKNKEKGILEESIKKIENNINEMCQIHGFKATISRDYKYNKEIWVRDNLKLDYIPIENEKPGYGYGVTLDGPSLKSSPFLSKDDYDVAQKLVEEIQKRFKEVSRISLTFSRRK